MAIPGLASRPPLPDEDLYGLTVLPGGQLIPTPAVPPPGAISFASQPHPNQPDAPYAPAGAYTPPPSPPPPIYQPPPPPVQLSPSQAWQLANAGAPLPNLPAPVNVPAGGLSMGEIMRGYVNPVEPPPPAQPTVDDQLQALLESLLNAPAQQNLGDVGGAAPAAAPAAPTYARGTYNLATSPEVILAQFQSQQGQSALDAWLANELKNAQVPYFGGGGFVGEPFITPPAPIPRQWIEPPGYSAPPLVLSPLERANAEFQRTEGQRAISNLTRENDLRKKAIMNRLAARGLLRSGDVEYLPSEADYELGYATTGIENQSQHAMQMADLSEQYQREQWQASTTHEAAQHAAQTAYQHAVFNEGLSHEQAEYRAQLAYQQASHAASQAAAQARYASGEAAGRAEAAWRTQQNIRNAQFEAAQKRVPLQNAVLEAYVNAYQFALSHPELYMGITGLPPQFGGAPTTIPAPPP
jgi:hypothetical protein